MRLVSLGMALAVGSSSTTASSDPHDGMVMHSSDTSFEAGVSVIAASYGPTTFYEGDYEGVTPEVMWSRGPVSASAMIGLYRIEENGLAVYGSGDLMAAGSM